MPLPISPNPTPFSESAAVPTDQARKQEWEEPHPGRRLSYPNDKPTTRGVYAGDEACRSGMAAEGLWPAEYADFNFAVPAIMERRLGRSRTRTMPRELALTNAPHARPEIQTAPLPRFDVNRPRHELPSFDCTSPEEVMPLDTPEITSEASGTDSDAESFISGPARKRQALQPLDTSFQGLQFTDFSKHLEIPVDAGHEDSFTWTEPEADTVTFSVMSPEGEDLYGWEAVLERKSTNSAPETLAPHQQRRASRSKRSLLQRVFSPGGSTPDEASRFPTSSSSLEFQGDKESGFYFH